MASAAVGAAVGAGGEGDKKESEAVVQALACKRVDEAFGLLWTVQPMPIPLSAFKGLGATAAAEVTAYVRLEWPTLFARLDRHPERGKDKARAALSLRLAPGTTHASWTSKAWTTRLMEEQRRARGPVPWLFVLEHGPSAVERTLQLARRGMATLSHGKSQSRTLGHARAFGPCGTFRGNVLMLTLFPSRCSVTKVGTARILAAGDDHGSSCMLGEVLAQASHTRLFVPGAILRCVYETGQTQLTRLDWEQDMDTTVRSGFKTRNPYFVFITNKDGSLRPLSKGVLCASPDALRKVVFRLTHAIPCGVVQLYVVQPAPGAMAPAKAARASSSTGSARSMRLTRADRSDSRVLDEESRRLGFLGPAVSQGFRGTRTGAGGDGVSMPAFTTISSVLNGGVGDSGDARGFGVAGFHHRGRQLPRASSSREKTTREKLNAMLAQLLRKSTVPRRQRNRALQTHA